jgi:uncharacterized surface anchored protein
MINLLVSEKLIDADSVDAVRVQTDIVLDLASLSGKSGRTIASEVVNQIGTVGAQETRLLGAVVDVDVAQDTLPSSRTVPDISTLDMISGKLK